MKNFLIRRDSDAVCHEDSEYLIRFKFEQVIIAHYEVFDERVLEKMQKLRKCVDSIWPISP